MGEIGNLFFTIFTQPIFNALVLLFELFGEFGLAIIVLTLVIKLILFPLTLQQLKSMKANQELQPHLAEIRKKHANDKQAQALAMQAVYKEKGISPLGGCLPMLVQLPVLYGLYYALSQVLHSASTVQGINQYLYPFIPHLQHFSQSSLNLNWFTSLNPSWYIPLGQPDPTHILPILAALATFIQLRISQPKPVKAEAKGQQKDKDAKAADTSAQMMKTMQYVMPLFTLFIGWTFPSGLALYWTVSAVFQAVQQFFVTRWRTQADGQVASTKVVSTKEEPVKIVESNGSSKAYKGDPKREQEITSQANGESGSNAIASRMRMTSRAGGNSSSNRRRTGRGSKASAQRRSTQKSR